jgi:hypothetical protein
MGSVSADMNHQMKRRRAVNIMNTGHFEGFGERAVGVIILKFVKMKLGCHLCPY